MTSSDAWERRGDHRPGTVVAMRAARRSRPATAVVVLAGALLAGPLAVGAQAHTELIGSSPAKNATPEQAPATVVLQFSEPVSDLGLAVRVSGPAGRVEAGRAKLAGAAVAQELQAERPAGRYTVTYRVTSNDGHPIEGTFSFTARSATEGSPTTSASPSASGSPTATPAVARPVATDGTDAGGDGVSSTWFVVGATIVGAGLLAAVAAIALPRRRPSGEDRPGPPSD
ncbi:copper resistance protein CopC [Spongisporangium articulatum]|uniref:Copper resistance protein CopC n=1 Tax=Spongisporangium articulatum TaxID=3362603 RepID=A0ABW8AI83_9ACTN